MKLPIVFFAVVKLAFCQSRKPVVDLSAICTKDEKVMQRARFIVDKLPGFVNSYLRIADDTRRDCSRKRRLAAMLGLEIKPMHSVLRAVSSVLLSGYRSEENKKECWEIEEVAKYAKELQDLTVRVQQAFSLCGKEENYHEIELKDEKALRALDKMLDMLKEYMDGQCERFE